MAKAANLSMDSSNPRKDPIKNPLPFMALVEAASSLLETNPRARETSMVYSDLSRDNEDAQLDDSERTLHEISDDSSRSMVVKGVIQGTRDDLVRSASKERKSFAELLMDVLDDESHDDILQWTPDGDAFVINNPQKFVLDKMPKLFNIRNMSSFVRKLGRWGFVRIHVREAHNADFFKHENFRRGEKSLCRRGVKCVGKVSSVKGTASPLSSRISLKSVLPPVYAIHPITGGAKIGSPLRSFPFNDAYTGKVDYFSDYINQIEVEERLLKLRLKRHTIHRELIRTSMAAVSPSASQVIDAAVEALRRDQEQRPIGRAFHLRYGEGALDRSGGTKYAHMLLPYGR